MKLGVSSYSYHRLISTDALDIFGAIKHAAGAGFEGIEFANQKIPDGKDALAYARELKSACAAAGIAACACAVGADFTREDMPAQMDELRGWVDFTSEMGGTVMRTDIMYRFKPGFETYEECLRKIAPNLSALAGYAQAKGVTLVTENHGWIFNESLILDRLVDQVGHDNFRVLADIGNFMCTDQDPTIEIGRLARLVRHVHLKDFHRKNGGEFFPGEGWFATRGGHYLRGAIVGHGEAGVLPCLKILDAAGYADWLILEFEGIEEPLMGIAQGMKNTRRMLDALDLFRKA